LVVTLLSNCSPSLASWRLPLTMRQKTGEFNVNWSLRIAWFGCCSCMFSGNSQNSSNSSAYQSAIIDCTNDVPIIFFMQYFCESHFYLLWESLLPFVRVTFTFCESHFYLLWESLLPFVRVTFSFVTVTFTFPMNQSAASMPRVWDL
jgi:hypothetical protein